MKILNILPIKLFEFSCEEDLLNRTLESVKNLDWTKNTFNKISKESLNLNPLFADLHSWFDLCLQEVNKNLDFPFEKIILTQSWANKTLITEQHHLHTHPNSLISAVFYLTSHNSGYTFFQKEDIWRMNLFFNNSANKAHENIKPTAGKLILFPSQLWHGVGKVESAEERYSISFNSFPSGKIGYFAGGLNLLTSHF
jgi:uncharacterized protein (TIGR02466 family)